METFLGDNVRNMYEAWKRDYSDQLKAKIELGANPYNFTSLIREICIGVDPHRGSTYFQDLAMARLEQLQIHKWKYILKFCDDFISIAS